MPEIKDVPLPRAAAPRSDSVSGPSAVSLRPAAPALLGYVAVRFVGVAILLIGGAATGKDGMHRLTGRWDSVWYQRIAEHGYGYEIRLPDGALHSDLAFFPLLPALERGLAALVPPLGVAGAGLVVSWLASLAAAWGIFAVGTRLHGRRAGTLLAVLWGVYPTAFVQSMAYTETLFTALAAWALYAVLTDRWITAGVLCVGAGLTRPVAVALIAAIGVTALWRLITARREGVPLRAHRRMVAGACLAPLGWLAYTVFVAVREGHPFAYFDVQAGWNNRIDGGAALAAFVGEQFGRNVFAGLGLCAAFALLFWVVWLCVRQRPRQPLPVIAYCLLVVVISLIGSGYFGSRPRLMMPAFPLLLPAAVALAGARWRTVPVVAVVGAAALASGAYGAFTLLGSGPP
ncbi:mannosyltransferase family protein [Streptomyces sp. NPDC057496]|uniref:mannosyltransferase family protein n=1 Tax=Streptomyces sp. NPDC057496 TaxID=3346149 RepID=UPI003694C25C